MNETANTYLADSELAGLIKAARDAGEPLRVKANGTTYELEVKLPAKSAGIWAGYDPEAARQAWRDAAGVLEGVDADALIMRLRDERGQDSPGRSWPS